MKNAIILAAGKGTRMQSQKNKVMHKILNKPMIEILVDNLEKTAVDEVVVVTGYQSEEIHKTLQDRVQFATQDEQKGTGDAVAKVSQLQGKEGSTLILLGDCALIQPDTLKQIYESHAGCDLTMVSSNMKHAGSYRRIIRDNQGEIQRVADYRSLSESERESTNEISLGVYCVDNQLLYKYVQEIQDDENTEEFNITKLVEIFKQNGHSVQALRVDDHREFLGVNDRIQLYEASLWLQERINHTHMLHGITIIDPKNTFIGPDVTIEEDVTIYPNTHIYGKTTIQTGTTIYPDCWLDNAQIGAMTSIMASRVTDSSIGDAVTVGPNAHIRMHCEIGNKVRIGNFVEFKNIKFDDLSRSAHLTYLGDANVGKDVNIGCGVVTANYDGKHKHRTDIGDGCFIGSGATLVAPVKIGDNVLVAAGSTITNDVEDGAMGIARSQQVVKPGYGDKFKNKEGRK